MKFRKTVTGGSGDENCPLTNTVDLTVINNEVPAITNDTCSTATTMSYVTTSFQTSILNNQSNLGACPTHLAPTDSGEALPASWDVTSSGDMWYKFSTTTSTITNPTIAMYGQGIYAPQIALYSGTCNSLSLITHAAGNASAQDISIQPTLSGNTTYYLRVSTGGTGNEGVFSVSISVNAVV